jgi:hypothetical protein
VGNVSSCGISRDNCMGGWEMCLVEAFPEIIVWEGGKCV